MLVLSRGVGETIHIGNDITIKVCRINNEVRLGIIAPRSMSVLRGELFDAQKPTQQPDVNANDLPDEIHFWPSIPLCDFADCEAMD